MGRFRRLLKRGLFGVEKWVSANDLFEKPGERPRTSALEPRKPRSGPPRATSGAGVVPSRTAPTEPARESTSPAPAVVSPSGCVVVDLDELAARMGAGGGVRVINHWATWCIPCVEEFADLKAVHAALPSGIEMWGVSWDLFDPRGDEDDICEHVSDFAAGHSLPWSSVLLGESVDAADFFERFGLTTQTVPQTWVLSGSGEVVLRIERAIGPSDLASIVSVVRALVSSGAGENHD